MSTILVNARRLIQDYIGEAVGLVDVEQTIADAAQNGTTVEAMHAAAQLAAYSASLAALASPNPYTFAAAIAAYEYAFGMDIVKLAVDIKNNEGGLAYAADVSGLLSDLSAIVSVLALANGAVNVAAYGAAVSLAFDLLGMGLDNLDVIREEFNNVFPSDLSTTLGSFIASMVAAFDRSQLVVLWDPIVLDLNGDGVKLTALADSNAYFDMTGNGTATKTGWIDANDGLLVVDRNGDGKINNITELFGSANTDGFVAMKAMDTNNDGVLNGSDSGFSSLKIWVDADGDGTTDSGELKTLADYAIASIKLNSTKVNTHLNGNVIDAANDSGRILTNNRGVA